MQPVPSDVAFSPAVKAQQERLGSRFKFSLSEQNPDEQWSTTITESLAAFIAARDTLFLATASAAGQPYVQHRGGPPGFLKVIDSQTLAFADFSGNRQYITLGNLSENDKSLIFLLDFVRRRRIKIWGTARVVEDDPDLLARLSDPAYKAQPQRAIVFRVAAWDMNCPSHISPRFTEAELLAATEGMRRRIEELEAELTAIRQSKNP